MMLYLPHAINCTYIDSTYPTSQVCVHAQEITQLTTATEILISELIDFNYTIDAQEQADDLTEENKKLHQEIINAKKDVIKMRNEAAVKKPTKNNYPEQIIAKKKKIQENQLTIRRNNVTIEKLQKIYRNQTKIKCLQTPVARSSKDSHFQPVDACCN